MKLDWKNRLTLSLQVRVTALVLTIFMAGIWLLSFYSHEVQREDTVKLLGKQQTAMASYVATEIDQELQDRFAALEKVADYCRPRRYKRHQPCPAATRNNLKCFSNSSTAVHFYYGCSRHGSGLGTGFRQPARH